MGRREREGERKEREGGRKRLMVLGLVLRDL